MGGPGGQNALLSRRFKGDLGNCRKIGNGKNEKNGTRLLDFGRILGARWAQYKGRSTKNRQKVARRNFGRKKKGEGDETSKLATYKCRKRFRLVQNRELHQNLGGPLFRPLVFRSQQKKVRDKWPVHALLGPALRTARGLRRGKGRGLTNPVDKILETN